MTSAFAAGLGLRFLVAGKSGRSGCSARARCCAERVLRIAIGAGAAVIDALYAALGVLGASALLEIDALRITFGSWAPASSPTSEHGCSDAFRIRLGGEVAERSRRRARVPHLARRHGVQPDDDRLLGRRSSPQPARQISSAGFPPRARGAASPSARSPGSSRSRSACRWHAAGSVSGCSSVDVVSGVALLGFAALLGYRTVADASAALRGGGSRRSPPPSTSAHRR